jgi:hypothetical protein
VGLTDILLLMAAPRFLISYTFLLLMWEGYGVYTNNEPGSSFSYCVPLGRNSQIIALRCLPGAYGEMGNRNILNAVGSPRGTLVLKTSEQCLVTYANKIMLTGSPATLFILPHRPLFPLGLFSTPKSFPTSYKMRQRLCLRKWRLGSAIEYQ